MIDAAFVALALAAAMELPPVAQVVRVDGLQRSDQVTVTHGGRPAAFAPFMLLYPGDRVHVTTPTVHVFVFSIAQKRTVDMGRDLIVSAQEQPASATPFALWEDLWAELVDLAPYALPVELKTRGEDSPARFSDLLPSVDQFLPPDRRSVTVVWTGHALQWTVSYADGGSSVIGGPATPPARIAVAEDRRPVRIASATDGVQWRLTPRSESLAPRPSYLPPEGPLSTTDRAIRAAWLLKQDAPQWRLFALSELADTSATDLVGLRFWRAVQTGAWPPKPDN